MSEGQIDLGELDDMISEDGEDAPKKASPVKAILSSLGIAALLAGVSAGIIFVSPFGKQSGECVAAEGAAEQHEKKTVSYEDIEFVNLDTLVISLGPNAKADYLKISISLETTHEFAKTAEHLQPRFRDVLNTYLRAVDEKDLVEPFAMTRLRAQILRRMQTVASSEIVSDVLITDFVLN
jgi:flagellar protein FliL